MFRRGVLFLLLFAAMIMNSSSRQAEGAVYRVKPGGTGDGSSWEKALDEQGFLSKLAESGYGDEFWIVAGTYRPAVPQEKTSAGNGSDLRESSFSLKNGVALYGGFAGNETARDQRNWKKNLTVLSGVIDERNKDNIVKSYHVVTAIGPRGSIATLDGFIISGGSADGEDAKGKGGGMHIDGYSVTVQNCIFTGNSAVEGGGVYAAGGSPVIRDCIFTENTADFGGGLFSEDILLTLEDCTFSGNRALKGGGMFNRPAAEEEDEASATSAAPDITGCLFLENTAEEEGGGIFNNEISPSVKDCTFSWNIAEVGGAMANMKGGPIVTGSTFSENIARNGGAMANLESSPVIINSTFWSNEAEAEGGALYNDRSSPIVVNVTFTLNSAERGGGMLNSDSSPVVANTILWGNGSEIRLLRGGTTTVTYSIVEGGFDGEGNIDRNPRLARLADNGGPTGTCALNSRSPAIDAGLPVGTAVSGNISVPGTDQRGVLRSRHPGADIGAYEYEDPDTPIRPGGASSGCSAAPGGTGLFILLLPLLITGIRRKK
jgi:hypothetical protein